MAMVMNSSLSFFSPYSVPSANANEQESVSSVFGDKILICTKYGFKWVSSQELEKEKHKQKNNDHYKCATCYVVAYEIKDFLPYTYKINLPILLENEYTHIFLTKILPLKERLLLLGHMANAPPEIA